MSEWTFDVQMWDEQMLDEIKNMIESGLVPIIDNDEVTFRTETIIKFNTKSGKTRFQSRKNT